MNWLVWSLLSALFAALTAILAKIGVAKMDANLATAYFHALQVGQASRVAPIDKLSVVLVILFAALFLGEPLTWGKSVGVLLIASGAITIALD